MPIMWPRSIVFPALLVRAMPAPFNVNAGVA